MIFATSEVVMNPEEYISRLTEVSNKKLVLLKDLLSLTQAQSGTINENQILELQELVDKKKAGIEKIDKLDEEFRVYFQRLKQTLQVKSLDEIDGKKISGVKELQEVIGNIMKLLKGITVIDSENSEKANDLLNSLSGEMKKISQTKKLGSAYTMPVSAPPSYFIDKKK